MGYLKYLDETSINLLEDIKKRYSKGKDYKWKFIFGKDDEYEMSGEKAEIVKLSQMEKVVSANKFIKSTVRIFWDRVGKKSNNLIRYISWLTKNIKKI